MSKPRLKTQPSSQNPRRSALLFKRLDDREALGSCANGGIGFNGGQHDEALQVTGKKA